LNEFDLLLLLNLIKSK